MARRTHIPPTEAEIPLGPFEADIYARWYNAQPADPSETHADPVAAFRRERLVEPGM